MAGPNHFGNGERRYVQPLRIRVSSEPTDAEFEALLRLPGMAKDVPETAILRGLSRQKAMAVLVASAAYVAHGETLDDNGARYHVVGTLVAPLFQDEGMDSDDIDGDRWLGKTVCEMQELVVDEAAAPPQMLHPPLIDGLLSCREELNFDIVRAVVPLQDQEFLKLLDHMGFIPAGRDKREVSMVRVFGGNGAH